MTNIKKFVFGLLVACLTVGFSAFTTATKTVAAGDIYVNLAGDSYSFLDPNEYDPQNCIETNDIQCAYRVTPEGAANVTAGFDADQAAEYLAEEWIEPATENRLGIYDPEQ